MPPLESESLENSLESRIDRLRCNPPPWLIVDGDRMYLVPPQWELDYHCGAHPSMEKEIVSILVRLQAHKVWLHTQERKYAREDGRWYPPGRMLCESRERHARYKKLMQRGARTSKLYNDWVRKHHVRDG